jgi:thiol-disulfide isomerase/thioredoxin
MSHLLNFYGRECPHCHTMEPIIDTVEKELDITVDRLEVWHDDSNKDTFESYDKGVCGGVPYFYNTETKASICGEATVEELKAWALGETKGE